jgi:hypothetical protein
MTPTQTVMNTVQHSSSYREVTIGKTLFCVTSVFNGEKELGPTLEKLAAQHVLDTLDNRAKEILQNQTG